MIHKNFELFDGVRIYGTNDIVLDGTEGRILGKSSEHIVDFYIVELPIIYRDHKAITLPESCLEKV